MLKNISVKHKMLKKTVVLLNILVETVMHCVQIVKELKKYNIYLKCKSL